MCLIKMETAPTVLRQVIRVQNHLEADVPTVVLPVKSPERFKPSLLHQEKNILSIHQREGIRVQSVPVQDLPKKWRVGATTVGYEVKRSCAGGMAIRQALLEDRVERHGNQEGLCAVGKQRFDWFENPATDFLQVTVTSIFKP